ncbi:MAG: hypothetical protein PHI64_16910 [Zoogloea sp.]|uniref:hypothetical protein n=1 Tax=Zoogloea sp. TaxID=49181 RepID=UPI002619407C|nr:hypothetical protein [Zoogloea sp.]MDD2990624.1 hypothetical protein [Zoogloea sp.]
MIIEVYFPGTPAVPGTPARYLELNGPSWSSGSVSIPLTPGDGGYKFQIPASVVGVFVGLATGYPGTGYFGIQHALYFSRGVVDVYESGQRLATLGSYVSSDEFTLIRQAGRVWFLRNGVKEFDRPSRLSGTFRLASTQYLTGDKVVDAEVVGVGAIPTSGEGVALLRPLAAYAFETAPANWGVAELAPLTGTASVDGHGWGTASLGGLMAWGSDRLIADGRARLPPLTAQGESGLIAPGFATGSSVVGPVQQIGRMIPGGIGAGLITTKLLALGSDRPIAQAYNELAPLFAWGAEGVALRGGAIIYRGGYQISGFGRQLPRSGGSLVGPRGVVSGYGGAVGRITGPRSIISASITIPVVARGAIVGPAAQVEGAATASETARSAIEWESGYAVSGYGGAVGRMVSGTYAISGHAVLVERAAGAIQGPGYYVIQGRATVGIVARGAIVGPGLVAVPVARGAIVGPSAVVQGVAHLDVPIEYEAYSVNLATGAVSRYTEFPFDQILRFGNKHFGVRPDGIYELTGGTDNGNPILASAVTFPTMFRTSNLKRVPYVYLVGRTEGTLEVGVRADEGPEYTFPTGQAPRAGVQAVRAKVAQGIRGNAFAFRITNPGGEDFEIERAEALVDVTTRTY